MKKTGGHGFSRPSPWYGTVLAFPQLSVFKIIRLESFYCYLLQFDILFFRERHIASIKQFNTNYIPATKRNNDTRSTINHSDFLLKHNGVTMTSKRREKSQFHMFFFPSLKFS